MTASPRQARPTAESFKLRPYRSADEEAVIALWQTTWQKTYPDIDFAARLPWWRSRWRDELVPQAMIVVAESDGEIVGFVTIEAKGYLDQLVVAPSEWGSPLAAALVCEAKRLSPDGITLKVNADNARAIRFYGKHGFAAVGNETNERSGAAIHVMTWKTLLIIRDATIDDAAEASEVMRRSIAELCTADHHDDPSVLEAWLANKTPQTVKGWIGRSGNSVLVAVSKNSIVAVGSVTDDGEIQLNYVAPEMRFQGASKAMLAALEKRAADLGNGECRLVSTETAKRFYLAAGYEPTGGAEGRFGTSPSYPMAKRLNQAFVRRP